MGEYRQLLQEAKLELKKSKRKDYYKILGVEKSANDDEIKKAYRKRAMVHHPDRHSSASEDEKKDHETKFKEVGEAYAILSDEKKRRMYDSGQDMEDTLAWVATTSTWAEHLAATRASPSSSDKKLEIHLQHSAPPPLCAQFYQFLPAPRSPPIVLF